MGSTQAVTDSTGATQAQYTYEPYGNTTVTGSAFNPFQYTGRENDGTGLYFYRARYYNPTLGRFISEDPIGFRGGINKYAYANDTPTNLVDPLGLESGTTYYVDWKNLQSGGAWPMSPMTGAPPDLVPPPVAGRKPREAATKYCRDNGQLSFNIPWTNIPVTVAASTTVGPANYSSTNDLNTVFPVIPWPAWFAFGASVDITINAPSQSSSNPIVGLGKNLSLGYFASPNGPQGVSLSLGPSIGPPINVSVPTNNGCGIAAGGS